MAIATQKKKKRNSNALTAVVAVSLFVTVLSLASIAIIDGNGSKTSRSSGREIDTTIKIAVQNGCGRSGLASMFAEKLRHMGYDVVNGMGENADTFDYDVSVVIDRKSGSAEKARNLAEAIGIDTVLLQRSGDEYVIEDVVLVIGRDWHTLALSTEE